MTKSSRRRTLALTSAASVAALLALAACSSNSSGGSSANSAPITLTEMDYYGSAPQNSQIQGVLNECGAQAGVKVVHEEAPRAQLVPKLLQEAASRSLPDLMLVDNPDLQQLASTGGLVSLSANDLSTAGLYPSIVSAGSYQGQTYGIAPGVNDLALYYNKDLFTKAGVTPPKTWAQLTADTKALTSGTRKGIAFSAAATEEAASSSSPSSGRRART
jgi:multiple sugar transport system substrate-binding protein